MSEENGTAPATRKAKLNRAPAVDGAFVPPSLFIATPLGGKVMYQRCAEGYINLVLSLQHSGIRFRTHFLGGDSLVTRVRNRIMENFLATDFTHMLFIDADVGFVAKDVDALMRGGFDVVAGAYPTKGYAWENMVHAAKAGFKADELEEASALYVINPTVHDQMSREVSIEQKNGIDFLEVLDAGTGFLLISRKALEAFIKHYGKSIEYVADYPPHMGQIHHRVFHADMDPLAIAMGTTPRYLSEDYWFCRKWQEMGGKVYLCLDAKLTHTGPTEFKGNVKRALFGSPDEPSTETEPAPPPVPEPSAPAINKVIVP